MARYDQGTIAWGASGKAVCVSGTGTIGVTSRNVLGLAVAGPRVAWRTTPGWAGLQGVADFCGGGQSGNRSSTRAPTASRSGSYNLWSYLYNRTGRPRFPCSPARGRVEPLPGGALAAGGAQPGARGRGAGLRRPRVPLALPAPAHLRDLRLRAGRDPALDPLRRATGLVSYASFHVTGVVCGATVPGDAELVPDDWSTLGVPPPVDAGVVPMLESPRRRRPAKDHAGGALRTARAGRASVDWDRWDDPGLVGPPAKEASLAPTRRGGAVRWRGSRDRRGAVRVQQTRCGGWGVVALALAAWNRRSPAPTEAPGRAA